MRSNCSSPAAYRRRGFPRDPSCTRSTTSSSAPARPAACSPIACPKIPNVRVLLLEAGPRDWHPFIHMPAGLAKLVGKKGVNWDYDTAPEPQLDNRALWWPRGKVLGGSSSINAMCYIRGYPRDYDDWAAQGASGWDWNTVLPYFKRSEGNAAARDALHGERGPAGGVRPALRQSAVARCSSKPARRPGTRATTISTARRRKASACTRSRRRDGARCSAAVAYLRSGTRAAEPRPCAPARWSAASPSTNGRANGVTCTRARQGLPPRMRRARCCSAAARSIRRNC